MSNKDLFVERRTQGDFAVRRANSQRASVAAETQAKTIAEARKMDLRVSVTQISGVDHSLLAWQFPRDAWAFAVFSL